MTEWPKTDGVDEFLAAEAARKSSDLAIYKSRHGTNDHFEAVDLHGSSDGAPMLFGSAPTFDEALAELVRRYPHAQKRDITDEHGTVYFSLPDRQCERLCKDLDHAYRLSTCGHCGNHLPDVEREIRSVQIAIKTAIMFLEVLPPNMDTATSISILGAALSHE